MPSRKKNPQAADLSALIKGLGQAGIEFIIVGGLAAVAQGAPISTFDLDIVHHQTDENIKRLFEFLKSIDAYQRRPDDKIIEPTEEDLKAKGHLLLNTHYGPLDILAYIEKGRGFSKLLTHTVEIEFHGYKVYVLSLDTILDLKRDSKDPKDRYRFPVLEETLRQIRENNKK
jgi:hypothetical protein